MFLLVRVVVSVCLPSIVGVKGSFQTTVLCPLILLKHTHTHTGVKPSSPLPPAGSTRCSLPDIAHPELREATSVQNQHGVL